MVWLEKMERKQGVWTPQSQSGDGLLCLIMNRGIWLFLGMVFQSVEKCQAPPSLPMAWAAVDSLFLIILCFFFFLQWELGPQCHLAYHPRRNGTEGTDGWLKSKTGNHFALRLQGNVAESRLHLEGGHKRKVPSRDKITQNTQTPPTSNLKSPVVSQWIYVGVGAI